MSKFAMERCTPLHMRMCSGSKLGGYGVKSQVKIGQYQRTKHRWGRVFVLPACLFVVVVMFIPIIAVFLLSLTSWNGFSGGDFVGLANFQSILANEDFWTVIKNNVTFMLVGAPLWTVTPLIVAVLMYEEIKGFKFFRAAFLLPSVLAASVIGAMFTSLFSLNGPVNTILKGIGLEGMALNWFGSASTSIPMLIHMVNWAGFGSAMLIILSGMSSIDASVYDSALIDGAGWWTRLIKITLPMLYDIVFFVFTLNIISSFTAMFAYIFVTTKGGPGYSTNVIEYFIYLKAFTTNEFGYACALSVLLFLFVFAVSSIVMALKKRFDPNE